MKWMLIIVVVSTETIFFCLKGRIRRSLEVLQTAPNSNVFDFAEAKSRRDNGFGNREKGA